MNIEKRQAIREAIRAKVVDILEHREDCSTSVYQDTYLRAAQAIAALDQADAADESANALMDMATRLDSIEAEILRK